jgi:hypothetical protein
MFLRENEIAERRRISRKHKKRPSQAETERRRRQSAQDAARDHRDRVLTFRMWCAVNNFSWPPGDES